MHSSRMHTARLFIVPGWGAGGQVVGLLTLARVEMLLLSRGEVVVLSRGEVVDLSAILFSDSNIILCFMKVFPAKDQTVQHFNNRIHLSKNEYERCDN